MFAPLLRNEGLLQHAEKTVSSYTSFQWEDANKRDVRNYQPGDTISFHQDHGFFSKGQFVTVEARRDDKLTVSDGAGQQLSFDPSRASGFDVGSTQYLNVAVGEKLLLRSNSKADDLRNGEIVEVKGFGRTDHCSSRTSGSYRLASGISFTDTPPPLTPPKASLSVRGLSSWLRTAFVRET